MALCPSTISAVYSLTRKVGLAPLLIELSKLGVLKAIAMNCASAIHDVEIALFGQTSEDVAENIMDGSFGMAKEPGDFSI